MRRGGAPLRGSGTGVCLIEAGPDYGPRASGAWPDDLLDPRSFTFTHDWGAGGEDERSLGARVIGGCSTHNACMAVIGTPEDYDEWGPDWSYASLAPYLPGPRVAPRPAGEHGRACAAPCRVPRGGR